LVLLFLGYEPYIDEVILRLLKIMRGRGYSVNLKELDPKYDVELRKITFFLILNTDASFKFDLKGDHTICHLLNAFPQFTKCLLLNIIWDTNLFPYYYDCLKYAPSWFILQFLDETIDSLKYAKPYEILDRVENLIKSIYLNICRSDFRSTANPVEKKIILNKFFDHIMNLLRHFNTPEADKKIFSSKIENHKYSGFSMKSILSLILYCFRLFREKPDFEVDQKYHIFKLMLEKEVELDNHSEGYSSVVEEVLGRINVALLNTLQNIVMNITLEIFMDWVEIDLPGGSEDEELTLQKLVGESAFQLVQLININECFKHDVAKQLECISIKPKEIQEIVKEATIGTILQKIEKDQKNAQFWFNELLSRGECVFGNLECLEAISDNPQLIDLQNFKLIIQEFQKYEPEEEELEKFHEIFEKCFQKFENLELLDLAKEFLEEGGHDFHLNYETEELDYEIINFTNKFTGTPENYAKIVLKNPKYFYEKLMDNLEESQEKQVEIILKILEETRGISRPFLKDFLAGKIGGFSKKQSKIPEFFAGVFRLDLLDRQDFVKMLMGGLSGALKDGNFELLVILLSALKQIGGRLTVEDTLAPLLVLLAHILEQSRWDLVKYTALNQEVVELTINIITDLMKTMVVQGSPENKAWITKQTEKLKPLTRYYFQKLSVQKGESLNFEDFLHPADFKNETKEKIVAFLCEYFVRCTSKEARWLGLNENLQPHFGDALLVVTVIVAKSGQEKAGDCLRKCVVDYLRILNVSIFNAKK
jgi:hypothetical protein